LGRGIFAKGSMIFTSPVQSSSAVEMASMCVP
jgi:hypothetical protein